MTPGRARTRRVPAALLVLLPALTATFALAGHSGASSATASGGTADAAQVARGRELFLQNCAGCHGQQGEGSERGPSLIGVGAAAADFWLSTGRMPLALGAREARRQPPAFGPADIAALDAYVASLGPGPPIPPVDTANGDLARGARLYEENCAACHSAAGTGGALTSGDVAPSLRAATPTQVGEAIRTGPGVMPSFSRSALDDHDVDSIAAYTQRLRHGGDAGGWATGRTGPLTEGLVGWLLGLGVLLWVIRRLGKRAGQ